MADVEIKALTKRFGAVEVIHGINLSIHDGEFVALVGPSGCGKSTLLRMLAGLESVSGGDVMIDGRNVNAVSPKDRDIAMVFQNYALYPNMSVRDNMAFSLSMQGRGARAGSEARVKDAAAILGLDPYLDRFPRALSGGQRQRVAMGRAIVRKPKVFLFDEPLSNLDAKLRVKMRTEIKKLHQQLRTTTVYVTHDQVEAMTMADRIVVLRDGHIEQVGAPLELYHRPANVFVAGFIGSPAMNVAEATLHSGRIELGGTPVGEIVSGRADGPVLLGVRPENILLAPDGHPAEVQVVEPTGPETFVFLKVFGQELVVTLRDETIPAPGDVLNILFQPGKLHVFDPETGKRV
jgi:multiple sugar transport system ATP-binding protein